MLNATWRPTNPAPIVARVKAAGMIGLKRAVVYLHGKLLEALNVSNSPVYRRGRSPTYPSPSKPGEPPRKRTGWLQRNVAYEIDKDKGRARIGVTVNARYGVFLETGTTRMKARPWLEATLLRNLPALRALARATR